VKLWEHGFNGYNRFTRIFFLNPSFTKKKIRLNLLNLPNPCSHFSKVEIADYGYFIAQIIDNQYFVIRYFFLLKILNV
jgi:hypothetical protein